MLAGQLVIGLLGVILPNPLLLGGGVTVSSLVSRDRPARRLVRRFALR